MGPTISRRDVLKWGALGIPAILPRRAPSADAEEAPKEGLFPPVKALTAGPRGHFFGYYDKCPWDAAGRRLLAMEVAFTGRQPEPGEPLTVGTVDLATGELVPFDTTLAWCWQQGCMLQWLGAGDREVIYNDFRDGRYGATVRDVAGGTTRRLPLPVYAVSRDGRHAVTLDFDRLHRLRPGYGYCAAPEEGAEDPAPSERGIRRMDLATGESSLIVSIARAAAERPDERFRGAHHWFNHLEFNPSGTRFILLHRWKALEGSRWWTRLYTARPDGTDLRLHADAGMVSHFDWRDDRTILAWARVAGEGGRHIDRYFHFDVESGTTEVVGEGILTQDGHCSYSPDRRWILTDTYPDARRLHTLILYEVSSGRRIDIGRFLEPPGSTGPWRCDLHPRWSRDGTKVCFDSTHEGGIRQMYEIDVGDTVRGRG